jgi:hypothetical protein
VPILTSPRIASFQNVTLVDRPNLTFSPGPLRFLPSSARTREFIDHESEEPPSWLWIRIVDSGPEGSAGAGKPLFMTLLFPLVVDNYVLL